MKSILIVAADTDARVALAGRLEQDDYLVMTAADADEARECLRGMLPGAIVIDLPSTPARRLIRYLSGSAALQLIPRLLVMAPLTLSLKAGGIKTGATKTGATKTGGAALPVAAAFVRPVPPDHLARALSALYPRGRWNVPAAAAVQAVHKAERIREAIELVAAAPAPPPTITLPPAPVDRPSARAVSVAQTYVLESMQERLGQELISNERISNDVSSPRVAASALPPVGSAGDVALSA
jgi:hypothetical protein